MLKQRVFLLMQGYGDANDARYLRYDPVLQTILDEEIVSQPTCNAGL